MPLETSYIEQLKHFFAENNFTADDTQLMLLAQYASLLAEKNKVVNLVSRKDIESVVENHVFITAYATRHVPEQLKTFIDIGTGGGLPAIPFAIMRRDAQGIAVDSIKKKTDAVDEFIKSLGLKNLRAQNSRVEEKEFLKKNSGRYDLVLTRASVPMITLLQYSLPLIQKNAYIAAIKGGNLSEEISKAEEKFRHHIKKTEIFEINYLPSNSQNEKEKKLVLMEVQK